MKLLSEAQNKILLALKEKSSLSVDQMTSRLGIAKTAARRHLLSLEKRGLLERDLRREPRGRPSLIFRLTSAAHRLFPSKEAEILNGLIRFLSQTGHEELLDRFFEQYWQKRYENIQNRLRQKGRDDFQTRLQVLKEELEKEGFMPRSKVVHNGSELMLQECHCPLESVVQETRLPCHLEKRLISRVLNAPVQAMKIRDEDYDGPCEYVLPAKTPLRSKPSRSK